MVGGLRLVVDYLHEMIPVVSGPGRDARLLLRRSLLLPGACARDGEGCRLQLLFARFVRGVGALEGAVGIVFVQHLRF